jgi:hypothetical protein
VQFTSAAVRIAILSLILFLTGGIVFGHDPGLSTAQLSVTADALELLATLAPKDVETLLSLPLGSTAKQGEAELEPRLTALAAGLFELRSEGALVSLIDAKAMIRPENNIEFHLIYARPPPGNLRLRAIFLNDLPVNHRASVSVADEKGTTVGRKMLQRGDAAVDIAMSAHAQAWASRSPVGRSFWSFLALGIRHIPTGYDHLMFLLGLLIATTRWRSLLTVTIAFTVAHSITLAAATFHWVRFPAIVVDLSIAGSIIYVGVENLWKKGRIGERRWIVAFGFGLIHGLGFATVLSDLGVGANGVRDLLLSLLGFNLGVEIGQVAIAAVVLPLLYLFRRDRIFVKQGEPFLSACILVAGVYWFIERLIFLLS